MNLCLCVGAAGVSKAGEVVVYICKFMSHKFCTPNFTLTRFNLFNVVTLVFLMQEAPL